MTEQLILTTAETVPAKITTYYRVVGLSLNWLRTRIDIEVLGENGEHRAFRFEGTTATNMLLALNTADLSIKSLQRRILERLSIDGKLVGTVTGLPD